MSLVVQNLTVEMGGTQAVKSVSMAVGPGHITTVLGPNGAGKSELVLGLAGTLPKSQGRVLLDGEDVMHLGPAALRAKGLAAVPEGHQVLSSLSVDENLRAAASGLPVAVQSELDRVYEVFPELDERKLQLAGSLSGGQQQMVAIGHALMAQPRYLLLDEMSLGLAPLIVKRLGSVIHDLATAGTGVLLIEQFTDMALELADYAVVMRQGEVQYTGTPTSLKVDPERLKDLYFG